MRKYIAPFMLSIPATYTDHNWIVVANSGIVYRRPSSRGHRARDLYSWYNRDAIGISSNGAVKDPIEPWSQTTARMETRLSVHVVQSNKPALPFVKILSNRALMCWSSFFEYASGESQLLPAVQQVFEFHSAREDSVPVPT